MTTIKSMTRIIINCEDDLHLGSIRTLKKIDDEEIRLINKINNLKDALQKIAELDPAKDSDNDYEIGQADCFNQAQKIAREALK